MRVGVPKERKDNEHRVALTPAGVKELVTEGNEVLVERGAGEGSSISDQELVAMGAEIVASAEELWERADLVLKVKEPIEEEYGLLRRGQVLFTYLHLAASRSCTEALLESGVTSIAYEMVRLPNGSLPLLAPMSEIAGRMAPQVGAHYLEREAGGRGVLMGGASGVYAAKVVVLGAGVAGMNAAAISLGMQAEVLMLDVAIDKLRSADALHRGHLQTVASNTFEVERACLDADLVIGAVLLPGARAPKVLGNDVVKAMKPGSVLVDIAIDQGGCFEASRPTSHSQPTFEAFGSTFYCVTNMPGAVPHTSTFALTNVTLPYACAIASKGWTRACREDESLASGLSTHAGHLLSAPVGAAHGIEVTDVASLLA